MLLLDSSLKKRFGYQLSYVLSKATGNVDNTGFGNWLGGDSVGLAEHRDHQHGRRADQLAPARGQGLRLLPGPEDRRLAGRRVHRATADGRTRRTLSTERSANLPTSARRQIFLEPRGTEKNDFFNQFDLRAEKAFEVSGHRFGVFADIFNLFNTATVTTRQARYPNTTISGSTVAYKAPTAVQAARQLTIRRALDVLSRPLGSDPRRPGASAGSAASVPRLRRLGQRRRLPLPARALATVQRAPERHFPSGLRPAALPIVESART